MQPDIFNQGLFNPIQRIDPGSGFPRVIQRKNELPSSQTESTPLKTQTKKIGTTALNAFCNCYGDKKGQCAAASCFGSTVGVGGGAIVTSPCWGTGTGLWATAGANATKLLAGQILVTIGSTLTSVACLGGCVAGALCYDFDDSSPY